jgi:hypothetical protein
MTPCLQRGFAVLALAGAAHTASAQSLGVSGGSQRDVGEYLVAIGGCNDCHTEGWNRAPGEVPTAQRLTGSAVGWHGPWGTSYAINLRLLVSQLTEDQWLAYVAAMQPKPPMPWFNMRAMSPADLTAMYVYIKGLGPPGTPTSVDLPPGQTPKGPYLEAAPVLPKP